MVGTTFTEIIDHHIHRGEETSDRFCLSNLADELGELWGLEDYAVQQITNLLKFPQTVKARRLRHIHGSTWESFNVLKDQGYSFFYYCTLLDLQLSYETHPYMIYYDPDIPPGTQILPPWEYARLHLEVKEKHCRTSNPNSGLATYLPLFLQNTTITIEEPVYYDRIAEITVDHLASGLPQVSNTYYLREQQPVLPTRVSIITNTLHDYAAAQTYYRNHPKKIPIAPDYGIGEHRGRMLMSDPRFLIRKVD